MPLVYITFVLINRNTMKHTIPFDTQQMTSLESVNNLTAAACCNFIQLHQLSFCLWQYYLGLMLQTENRQRKQAILIILMKPEESVKHKSNSKTFVHIILHTLSVTAVPYGLE